MRISTLLGSLKYVWRDWPVIAIVFALCVTALCIIIPARSWGVLGPTLTRINTQEKVVALTFDDGPTPAETAKLLKVLQDDQVKATFYLIGVEIERAPKATEDIIAAGHEVGNHSYTHSSLMFMSYDVLNKEITRTDTLIRQHGYVGQSITIRPPYGHKLIELPLYASLHHRQLVMWDLVLGNHPHETQATILRDADKVRPGSIIIMHPMYAHNATTLDAVRPLIEKLKSQGYRFVTVSELLNYR